MNKQLLNLLVDPNDNTPLSYDEKSQKLYHSNNGTSYEIEQGVPVLYPKGAEEKFDTTKQHEDFNSKFYYIDHYKKDALSFDYFAEYEDGATTHENRRLHEAIIREVPKEAAYILDVGSGGSWVAQHFCPKGVSVCSFDVTTKNTVQAIQKYPYDNHHAVTGDAFFLPFKEDSIDCIIAAEIIEHVPNPANFIKSLFRVLKPDGKLIITTPHNEKIPYNLCVHCNCPTPRHAHLHSFDERKILSLVPTERVKTKAAYSFSNVLITKLKTHIVLKYVPFSIWFGIDKIANLVTKKKNRLLLKVEKA